MKIIQWYPGHMAKAMRMMEEQVKLCDAVVFVLDARAPASSYNPKLSDMVGAKPVLFVLNKADLAGEEAESLAREMRGCGRRAVRVSANSPAAKRVLREAMEELVREKTAKMKEKGISRPLRFLIAGVPNTGKSTLINLLSGEKKAQTGDKAGVTRAKQWVKCGGFELLDTPGTMPPSCEDQHLARRLAYVGCINDDILALDEIALSLLSELALTHPEELGARYGITAGLEAPEMLDRVCVRRGFLLRGKEPDYDRGERAVIDDFRKGKLGRVTLDGIEDLAAVGLTAQKQ